MALRVCAQYSRFPVDLVSRRTATERRVARKTRALSGDLQRALEQLDAEQAERDRIRFWCRLAAEPPVASEHTS